MNNYKEIINKNDNFNVYLPSSVVSNEKSDDFESSRLSTLSTLNCNNVKLSRSMIYLCNQFLKLYSWNECDEPINLKNLTNLLSCICKFYDYL